MPWAKQLFDWKEGLVLAGGLVLLAVIAVILFFATTWTLRGAVMVVLWLRAVFGNTGGDLTAVAILALLVAFFVGGTHGYRNGS